MGKGIVTFQPHLFPGDIHSFQGTTVSSCFPTNGAIWGTNLGSTLGTKLPQVMEVSMGWDFSIDRWFDDGSDVSQGRIFQVGVIFWRRLQIWIFRGCYICWQHEGTSTHATPNRFFTQKKGWVRFSIWGIPPKRCRLKLEEFFVDWKKSTIQLDSWISTKHDTENGGPILSS